MALHRQRSGQCKIDPEGIGLAWIRATFKRRGSEETSGPIFLEAGKAYYVEMIKKEGGGGDNASLAWSTPEDEGADVEIGGLPISR